MTWKLGRIIRRYRKEFTASQMLHGSGGMNMPWENIDHSDTD
jgi:hypothetical protein